MGSDNPTCPICREDIEDVEEVEHTKYTKYASQDRQRIVECADKGGDWKQLAATLNIKYKTAYGWVRSGEKCGGKRGGYKRRYLSDEQLAQLMNKVEEDPELTLRQMREFVQQEFNVNVSLSTMGNYLDGQLYSIKKLHHRPITMNSENNKQLRKQYVESLNAAIQQGKDIVWIDETNFNLFCRRSNGWSRIGTRAVQDRPSARGPNLHVIGCISCEGIVLMTKIRGAFRNATCNAWITSVLEEWERQGKDPSNLVLVCDNAPCHSRIQEALTDSGTTLLRLAPYSPTLNPIETVWSSLKSYVRGRVRIPQVVGFGVGEQRMQYLEDIVQDGLDSLNDQLCVRAYQHSASFHGEVLALRDLRVGE